MAKGKKRDLQQAELSQDELAQQEAADLPDRENMSLVNANLAAPINAAIAANVLSDNSSAIAVAEQTAPIDQSI
jgi:hypothetical protein